MYKPTYIWQENQQDYFEINKTLSQSSGKYIFDWKNLSACVLNWLRMNSPFLCSDKEQLLIKCSMGFKYYFYQSYLCCDISNEFLIKAENCFVGVSEAAIWWLSQEASFYRHRLLLDFTSNKFHRCH